MICKVCYGKCFTRSPLKRCACKHFCIKCENKEGLLSKPWEPCDYCLGTGSSSEASKVLCLEPNKILENN